MGSVDEFTVHQYGGVIAWNKLYSKLLFRTIRYPEGRVFEDIATTHKLVHLSKRMIMVEECLYHHTYRKESISHNHLPCNKRDEFISTVERHDALSEYGYPKEKIENSMCGAALGFLASTTKNFDEVSLQAKKIVDSTRGIPKELSRNQKRALIIWKINKRLFYLLGRMSGRRENNYSL